MHRHQDNNTHSDEAETCAHKRTYADTHKKTFDQCKAKNSQDEYMQAELDQWIGVDDEEIVRTNLMPHIMDAELPKGFTWLVLKPYDGATNPKVFITHYKYNMLKNGCQPIHICKIFIKYLTDAANAWYNELTSESISNFREHAIEFFNRFFQKSMILGSKADLLNVRQRADEPLSEFML